MILTARRTETIKFGAFLSGEYKGKQKKEKRNTGQKIASKITKNESILPWIVGIPIFGDVMMKGTAVFADGLDPVAVPVGVVPDVVKEKIVHAFDPLIDLMVGISLPIAGVMLTGGALMIMVGQKDLGFKLIMNSALGYVLVQMAPLFIDLLAGVGSAI